MRPNPSVALVANATSSRWSQAYSTLNLYIVLYVAGEDVAKEGKTLLERVQREYFALDTKNLASIKEAVERVVSDIDVEYSLTLVAIQNSVAYIVTASCGRVVLFRDHEYGTVASGEAGVHGYSGHVQTGDTLLIGTCDFFEKVDNALLSTLSGTSVERMSEMLAPVIHTQSTGGEAGVIVRISAGEDDALPDDEPDGQEEEFFSPPASLHHAQDRRTSIVSRLQKSIPNLSVARIRTLFLLHRRESIIAIIIVLLLAVLGMLLVRDRLSQQQDEAGVILAEIQPQIDDLLENADAMSGVEPSRAIDFLREAQDLVNSQLSSLPDDSPARDTLLSLLQDIQSQLDSLEGGESVALSLFFENQDYSDPLVAHTPDGVFVVSGESIARVSGDGDIEDTGELDGEAVAAYGLENFVYVLSDAATYQIDVGNLTSEEIYEDTGVAISAFGTNAYILTGDDIVRSSGGSYFENSPLSDAVSLAIDGAVYVAQEGEIYKFLRGASEDFEISGLVTPLGKDTKLYTNEELESLYVLDPVNARVVKMSKEGEFRNLYKSPDLSDATSFAVDGDTVYITSSSGVFTFEM